MLTLLLALLVPAHAKDPCKSVRTDENAFGETTRGRVVYVGIGGYLAIALFERDGKRRFQAMYVRRGDVDLAVPAGTPGDIKLADGTTLTLKSSEEALPITNANESTVFTQWQIHYDLDDATLRQLANSPVVAVRTEIGEDLSFPIRERKSRRLADVARCFAQ
jgi:hypothetical protein